MISPEIIEEIRQKADIVQIISSYINVTKKGNSYVAICPFHADTNPSMQISPTKQIYKCFVCGKGGNVFNFVSEYEKISYFEAVSKVAEMIGFSGIEIKAKTRVVDDKTKKILNALKEAKDLYKYLLKSKDGESCTKYLRERNISEEMQDYFELGYSSSNAELPIKLLRSKGIEVEELEEAGILSRLNGQFVDRYSRRLIFPIYNEFSEVIGYSGRIIEKSNDAKYINTKETIVFNKSHILYNYQNAKNEAKREGFVYVTEGFMDVFALYKVGIKSSVALMGTAFTPYHAKMLRKLNVEVRLCLDGDDAGQHGMLKASEILDKENIKYKIVDYKGAVLDPDEILQKYGEEKLNKLLQQLVDRNQFVLSYSLKRADLTTTEGKKKFAESMIPFVKAIDDLIDRDMIISDICYQTGISQSIYKSLVNGNNVNGAYVSSNPNQESYKNISKVQVSRPMSKRQLENLQDNILYQLLCFKEAVRDMEESGCYFINDIYERIRNYIVDGYEKNDNFSTGELISVLSQSNDVNSSKMIDSITSIVQKDGQKKYDKDTMMETLTIYENAIKNKKNKDYIESLKEKNYMEKAELYKKFHDEMRGEK